MRVRGIIAALALAASLGATVLLVQGSVIEQPPPLPPPVETPPPVPSGLPGPPVVYGITGGGEVERGQRVTLTVSFYSPEHAPTFSWRKGEASSADATSDRLVIEAATASDAGTYYVTVTNSLGSSVASTALTVKAAAPPVIVTSPAATVAYVGQEVVFRYVATGSYPRTHQWRKDGVDLTGATQATYRIDAVTAVDAGTYAVAITNALGSATTSAAALTVNAATPVTISANSPSDLTATVGGSASFSVFLNGGSPPYRYQWFKDGQAIVGATDPQLDLNDLTLADAGKYSVVVSNAASTATSRTATLSVNPPTPVTFSIHPQTQTVYVGKPASFYVSVHGSSPITFQWLKDGAPIAGATSGNYSIATTSLDDSGSYSVQATNPAGTVTSRVARLTVSPPVLPSVYFGSTSRIGYVGSNVNLSAMVSGGTSPFTYRWEKDGLVIPGATDSWLGLENIKAADAGRYVQIVTNAAGTVRSEALTFAVEPPPLPPEARIYHSYWDPLALDVFVSNVDSPPVVWQWYKNDQPIVGATSRSYSIPESARYEPADYTVVLTNAAGQTVGPVYRYVPSSAPQLAQPGSWVAAERDGDVAYFAFPNPARIERYDLIRGVWLATLPLNRQPTGLRPDPAGLFVAYGKTVSRLNLDGTGEQEIVTVEQDVQGLFVRDGVLYVFHPDGSSYSNFKSIRLSDRTVLDSKSYLYGLTRAGSLSFAPTLGKFFGRDTNTSPEDIRVVSLNANGTFAGTGDSPYHGDYPDARRTFVSQNETIVVNDNGIVYKAADLTYAGSLGTPLDDVAFGDSGAIVALRGPALTAYNPAFVETGAVNLAGPASRVFVAGDAAVVFRPPSGAGTTIGVTRVPLSQFGARLVRPQVEANGLRYVPDEILLGSDGTVYLLSRLHGCVFRWSVAQNRYLEPLMLDSGANALAYSASRGALYAAHMDGRITKLDAAAAAPREQAFASNPRDLLAIGLADDFLFAFDSNPHGGHSALSTYDASGRLVARLARAGYPTASVWNKAKQRIYYTYPGSDRLTYVPVQTDGTLGALGPAATNLSGLELLRVTPDGGSLLLGNGVFYNGDTLQPNNLLPVAIEEATWVGLTLFTARTTATGARIERWGGNNYGLDAAGVVAGRVLRLFGLADGRLLVVAMRDGAPAIFTLDPSLRDALPAAPEIVAQPGSASVQVGAAGMISLALSTGQESVRWHKDGVALGGTPTAALTIAQAAPADVGLYRATVEAPYGSTRTSLAILGLATTEKVTSGGSEIGPNILHPNGRRYDQVLLQATGASITADPDQLTRVSFIDLDDDIVQVEFAGPGTLTVMLRASSGPASPTKYRQPGVAYMKGHAAIVVTGANENTHLSVFTVGRATAHDPTGTFNSLQAPSATNDPARNGSPLFQGHETTTYDGIADLAYIAILSSNGRFGSLRCANANFFSSAGVTGIYAPQVQFTGPVYVGNIDAWDDAEPALILGAAEGGTLINGGDLAQTNGRAVQVSGITQLKFVDGTTSHGALLPAQRNRARLQQDGVDVTDQIVVNPSP